MRAALDIIRADPEAGTELHLALEGLRRSRVGGLRIIYRMAGEIEVLAIGPRETIYEEVARLLRPLSERPGRYFVRPTRRASRGRRKGARA